MSTGRASRFAFDPAVVVAFLEHHTTVVTSGVPRRRRRLINGRTVNRDHEARIIRRWRTVAEGLTMQGVAKMLLTFDLSVPDLQRWAAANGLKPVLRGNLPPTKPTKETTG